MGKRTDKQRSHGASDLAPLVHSVRGQAPKLIGGMGVVKNDAIFIGMGVANMDEWPRRHDKASRVPGKLFCAHDP